VGLALFYMSAFILSIPAVSELIQPQMCMTLHALLSDIRYYILQATVPAICLLPDITLHCLKGVYFPELEQKLMLAATEDPLPRKLPPNLSALRYDQTVAKSRFS